MNKERTDLEYQDWYKRLDDYISARMGVGVDDLPDACWRDMFDDGATPASAWKQFKEDNDDLF